MHIRNVISKNALSLLYINRHRDYPLSTSYLHVILCAMRVMVSFQCLKWGYFRWGKNNYFLDIIVAKKYIPSCSFWHCGTIASMMTSSNGNIFRVTGHLCREFTGLRWIPRTKASDAELWCFLWSVPDKRLSKQSWGWWFETQSGSLWRHSNVIEMYLLLFVT